MSMGEKKGKQLNFQSQDGFNARLLQWLNDNGYERNVVFRAAIKHVVGLSHEQRMELFREAGTWQQAGFPGLPQASDPVVLADALDAAEQQSGEPARQSSGRSSAPRRRAGGQ